MMGKFSRDKGARFEREIVKRLTKWWGSEFQRTPQSGGSQLANGWNLAGDVCTPDETFPFHVECKHVEGWDLSHLLTTPNGGLLGKWLEQACSEAAKGKTPLVVFKRNRHRPMAMFLLVGLSEVSRVVNEHCHPAMELEYFNKSLLQWQALYVCTLDALTEVDPVLLYEVD